MELRATRADTALAQSPPPTERPLLSRLQDLSGDILILQRQLVLALTEDDCARARAEATSQARMAAACIAGRLAEGHALLQRRGVETQAIAAFRAEMERAEPVLRSLRAGRGEDEAPARNEALVFEPESARGLGLARLARLSDMDDAAARVAKAVLLASGLFLTAAHQVLAALAPRHEPETSEAFDRQRPLYTPALAKIA